MQHLTWRVVRQLIAIVAVMTLLPLSAAGAQVTEPVLTGHVTFAGGAPIAGVMLDLYDTTAGTYYSAVTDDAGAFAFETVEDGSYTLAASAEAGYWYSPGHPDEAGADIITVTGGVPSQATADVTYTGIAGTVTDYTNAGLQGAWINAYDAVEGTAGESFGLASADDTGEFFLPILPGRYILEYSYWSEQRAGDMWSGGAATEEDAAVVEVTDTAIVDNAHAAFSAVKGTLSLPAGTDSATVSLGHMITEVDGDYEYTYFESMNSAYLYDLSSGGAYELLAAPGTYKVQLSADRSEENGQYSSGYYYVGDTMDPSTASDVVVSAAAATTVNGSFETVSGTVRRDDGSPTGVAAAGADVQLSELAADGSREYSSWHAAGPDGSYSLLAGPGTYNLSAEYALYDPATDDYSWYSTSWYDGATSTPGEVDTTAGPLSGLDMTFRVIRGSVTSVTNADAPVALPGIDVWVTGATDEWGYFDGTVTDADGNYEVGVPAGDYKVMFDDYDYETDTGWFQYYNRQYDFDSADVVTVTPGSSASEIDGVNRIFSGVSTVSGRILGPDGPLPEASANFEPANGSGNSHTLVADSSGLFTGEIPNGEYVVELWGGDEMSWGSMYFPASATRSGAEIVTITGDTTNIDGTFTTVSGTVTLPSAHYEGWVTITGDPDQEWPEYTAGADVTADGTYRALVPPGTGYAAEFDAAGGSYTDGHNYSYGLGYQDGAARMADAPTFDVPEAGQTGIDVEFGLLSGTVKDQLGGGLDNTGIEVYNAVPQDGWSAGDFGEDLPIFDWRGYAYSATNGAYEVPVTTGPNAYKVQFQRWGYDDGGVSAAASSSTYETQWFDNQATYDAADPVAVTDGVIRTGIDATFALQGIAGRVTGPDGQGLAHVCVSAFDADGEVGSTSTRSDGTYTFILPPGSYTLKFIHCVASPVYQDRWFIDGDGTEPTPIVVAPKAITSGRNVAMATGFVAAEPIATTTSGGTATTTVDPRTGESKTTMPRDPAKRSPVTYTFDVTCADGTTLTADSVELVNGSNRYPMAPLDADTFTYTIPGDAVVSGDVVVAYACNEAPTQKKVGTIELFDPSGIVSDPEGNPVEGATVTLYYVPGWGPKQFPGDTTANTCESNLSKADGAAWSQEVTADNLADALLPPMEWIDPQANPQMTNSIGYYGWLVATGCWFVTVDAEGFEPYTSALVGVPPEVTDLDITLERTALDAPTGVTVTPGLGAATVTWTKPAGATDVEVRMLQGAVAPTPLTGTSVCVEATRTTCTATRLAAGKDYSFAVFGRGPTGIPGAVTTSTVRGTSLTSAVKPKKVVFGKATTFSGKLTRVGTSTGLGGRTIEIQTRTMDAKKRWSAWSAPKVKTTSSTGAYSFALTPKGATQFRATFEGAGDYLGRLSTARTVSVAPKVTSKLSDTKVGPKKPVSFSGAVAPNLAGKKVYLQRLIGGKWKDTAKTMNLTAKSKYAFSVASKKTGSYTYRLRLPAYGQFVKAFSPAHTLKIK